MALNQYDSREVPRVYEQFGLANNTSNLTMVGTAPGGANVTVSNLTTVWTGNYWYNQVSFSGNNANGPQWTSVNITAIVTGNHTSTVTGNLYLRANPEVFSHDADGNLLSDGRWNYVWDAENRLSALVTSEQAVSAGMQRKAIVFGYDPLNRKVGKATYDWNAAGNGTWNLTESIRYLYDGNNLVAEMNAMPATPTLERAYAWGPDLSGTMTGAGGVGGLLMVAFGSVVEYYGYDGNGNVQTMVDTSGNVVANYDYDAFGNTVRETGTLAEYNRFRFSTKYSEIDGTVAGHDTGLYYYGVRWYNPGLGRWISQDPSGEQGGINLYGNGNDFVNGYDALGKQVFVATTGAFYSGPASLSTHYALIIADEPCGNNKGTAEDYEISWIPSHWMNVDDVTGKIQLKSTGTPIIGEYGILDAAWGIIRGIFNLPAGGPLTALETLGRPSYTQLTGVKWSTDSTGTRVPNLTPWYDKSRYTIVGTNDLDSSYRQAAVNVAANFGAFGLFNNCGAYVHSVVAKQNGPWPSLPWSETNFGVNGYQSAAPAPPSPRLPPHVPGHN